MEVNTTNLEQRLTGVESNLRALGSDMKEIKDCLLGNEFNKTGVIHTIAEHHQRLNMLERTMERGKWLVIGLSMGTGGFIWEVLKRIFL